MKKIITAVLAAAMLGGTALAFAEPEVNQRLDNQQGRIAQGQASGELTHHEATVWKTKDRTLKQEIKADRAANGGKLTPAEKAKVNHQENQVSRKIARKKHNDVTK